MISANDIEQHEKTANTIRKSVLDIIRRTKSPHIGPSFSIVEILVALYFNNLKHTRTSPIIMNGTGSFSVKDMHARHFMQFFRKRIYQQKGFGKICNK
jgi:hypothetical protein